MQPSRLNKASRLSSSGAQRTAFTIIEVIVVVGIIVLLISILIPAVSSARSASRRAATNTQMRNIALACESYFQNFQAYPGMLNESVYDGGSCNVHFSSSQALVVSLTRAFYIANPTTLTPPQSGPPLITLPAAQTPIWVSDNPAVSPKDFSENAPNGRTYDPYVNPSPAELSSSIGLFGASTTTDAGINVPTFVDSAYGPDALPILYYRPARKYDPSVTDPANPTTPMAPVGQRYGVAPNAFSAFYTASNEWLGLANNVGPSSSASKTLKNSSISNFVLNKPNPADNTRFMLQDALFNKVGTTNNYVARGAFVLISAGTDRTYGADLKGNTDDIIVPGGN